MSAEDFCEEVASRIAEEVMGELRSRSGILDDVDAEMLAEIQKSICLTTAHILMRDIL